MMLAASSGMLLEADSLVSLAIKRERTVSSGSRALWVSGLADICWTSGKPLRRPKCHIRRRGALALRDVASCQAGGLFIRASEGLHGDDEEEARAVRPLSPPRAPRNLQESEIAALHEALVERRAPAQGVLGSPGSRLLCASFRNRQSTPKLGHHDTVSHLSFIRTVYSIFSMFLTGSHVAGKAAEPRITTTDSSNVIPSDAAESAPIKFSNTWHTSCG